MTVWVITDPHSGLLPITFLLIREICKKKEAKTGFTERSSALPMLAIHGELYLEITSYTWWLGHFAWRCRASGQWGRTLLAPSHFLSLNNCSSIPGLPVALHQPTLNILKTMSQTHGPRRSWWENYFLCNHRKSGNRGPTEAGDTHSLLNLNCVLSSSFVFTTTPLIISNYCDRYTAAWLVYPKTPPLFPVHIKRFSLLL